MTIGSVTVASVTVGLWTVKSSAVLGSMMSRSSKTGGPGFVFWSDSASESAMPVG